MWKASETYAENSTIVHENLLMQFTKEITHTYNVFMQPNAHDTHFLNLLRNR